jgi:hypothetical protein
VNVSVWISVRQISTRPRITALSLDRSVEYERRSPPHRRLPDRQCCTCCWISPVFGLHVLFVWLFDCSDCRLDLDLELDLNLDLDWIWIWKWHWNMNAFMDIRRRHDCLASRISHLAFRISHFAFRISHLASRISHLASCFPLPVSSCLSRSRRCVPRPRRYLVVSFPFFFFQSSASAFVFGIPYIRIFFSPAWSNSKKGGVQGHNAS